MPLYLLPRLSLSLSPLSRIGSGALASPLSNPLSSLEKRQRRTGERSGSGSRTAQATATSPSPLPDPAGWEAVRWCDGRPCGRWRKKFILFFWDFMMYLMCHVNLWICDIFDPWCESMNIWCYHWSMMLYVNLWFGDEGSNSIMGNQYASSKNKEKKKIKL